MTRRNRLLAASVLFIPILVYAYAGRFSRLMADDYCYVVNARVYGFPQVIRFYYDNWFGRLTQTVGAITGASLGVPFAQFFPALLLLLWLIGLLWLCRELARLLNLADGVTIVVGALLILYATLAGTPQIFHSLYWISAVFPFTVPLVLATYYAAIILRVLRMGHTTPLAIFACIMLALVAEFSSEPFALAFVGALAAGILGVLAYRPRPQARRAALRLLVASGITALLALGIMVAAPGNTLRQSLFPPTHSPVPLAVNSLVYSFAVIVVLVQTSPVAVLLALFLPAVLAYEQPTTSLTRRELRIAMALAGMIGFGLIVLSNVPAIYATSTAPPARALIIPQFVLVCACCAIGWVAGLSLRKSGLRPARWIGIVLVVALLLAGPFFSAAQMVSLMPRLSIYAQEWDSQQAQIVAAANAGQDVVTVAPLSIDVASMTGLDTISADAGAFTNACAASYYGVKSLSTSG